MKSSARRFGLAVVLFSLAGCGLKGPLYLPDDKQQEVPPAAPPKPAFEGSKVLTLPPAPQAQKKDRAGSRSSPPNSSAPGQTQAPQVSPPDPDRPTTPPPLLDQ
jgi:predicted small lipoprotein YifL